MSKISRPLVLAITAFGAFAGGVVAAPASADQPFMRTAFNQLAEAKSTLRAGRSDKGGHRLKAIALIDRAMAEVRAGSGYAGY